jgi:hypothetical protein
MGKAKPDHADDVAPQLRKSIFQLRFKPLLSRYGRMFSAAEKLTDYPDWSTTGLHVVLRDFEHRCSVSITHKTITYEQDSDDLKLESARIQQVLEVLAPALKIDTLLRVGFRRQFIVPLEMKFETLVAVVFGRLYSQESGLRKLLPPQVDDTFFRVHANSGDDKYHISVGPAKKEEVRQMIPFNKEHHVDRSKPDEDVLAVIGVPPPVSLYVDIDFFREADSMPVKAASEFFTVASEKVRGLASQLASYVLSTEV